MCSAKQLLRLPNHLSQVHGIESDRGKNVSREKIASVRRSEPSTPSLVPFEPCSSICISGPTGSGKTQWVYRFLTNLSGMYENNPPRKILYCYGVYQNLFSEMEANVPELTTYAGVPSQTEIEEFSQEGQHGLIVLDDLMHQVLTSKEVELLFTQGCHHRNLSVIFISQNLYGQAKSARTIALNTWYLVLFKNMRDRSQIQTLGRQLFLGKGDILVEAYSDAVKKPFGYLVIDSSPRGDDTLRLRTRIFPGEEPIVYLPKV